MKLKKKYLPNTFDGLAAPTPNKPENQMSIVFFMGQHTSKLFSELTPGISSCSHVSLNPNIRST